MARGRWGRRIEFLLTAVGYSVGIGDIWRFPFLVMKNGGGAFLIPIIIFNIFGAMPIVYLEMIMGQYSQSGALSVWRVCPALQGVGYGTIIAAFLFSVYYAVLIGWMLYYFIHSFSPILPWATCDNSWNTDACVVTKYQAVSTAAQQTTASNVSSAAHLVSSAAINRSISGVSSFLHTTLSSVSNATEAGPNITETASEQFFRYRALQITDGLHHLGSINWPIFGCLLVIELICFACIFKGVKITGKVVYFTVLGPFIILFVFLMRGIVLPGSDIGIKYYITPDLEKLKDPRIWAEACMQVFRSVGPGFGCMITFASFNKFNNNCMRDAILVCLADLTTGFLGGFVIFSVLGHVSYQTGVDISAFKQSGLSLGFIAYPEAAQYLPPPQLWCALFFFMSIFLGIDSQFPNYEIVVTAIMDEFPKYTKGRTMLMTVLVICVAFGLAIPQVTQGGMYLLTLVDWYAGTFSVTVFALIELFVMTYVYGLKQVDGNMMEMTGKKVPVYFKICWWAVTPVLLVVTLGFTVYTYAPPMYGNYTYPSWAVAMGWCISATSLVPIPLYLVYRLRQTPGTIMERLTINLKPSKLWGPPPELHVLEPKFMPVTQTSAEEQDNQ